MNCIVQSVDKLGDLMTTGDLAELVGAIIGTYVFASIFRVCVGVRDPSWKNLVAAYCIVTPVGIAVRAAADSRDISTIPISIPLLASVIACCLEILIRRRRARA